jgi:hypothetical protein
MGDDPDDFVNRFVNSPQRPIGKPKRKAKAGPAAKLRRDTIAAIQELKYLGSRPCVVPVYTGAVEIDGKRYSLGRLGSSDLVVAWFGLFVAIELKAGADRTRPAQEKFASRIAEAGAIYLIVREPADAVKGLMRIYQERVAGLHPKGATT